MKTLYFNGIDGDTGGYLFPPTTAREVAAAAKSETADRDEIARLERWREQMETHRRLLDDHDPRDLAQAGWGVIFAAEDPAAPAAREALGELLAYRRGQAARAHESYYQEYAGERGYRKGESKLQFLVRYHVGSGAADPAKMPYYLLLVGDPETIPWSFQYQLDVQYAVGRICFETPAEYAAYAKSVVAAETAPAPQRRRAVLFATRHPGDSATDLSAGDLATPLAERLAQDSARWDVATAIGAEAKKARLAALLGGGEEADLVFTASHGLGYPSGHQLQLPLQGALLCQDFPGFGHRNGPIPPEHYFAADDVADSARVHGLVTFHFACYSAGAPEMDDFQRTPGAALLRVAPKPFLSRLAQRLTGHPRGGALAVIGHVEKAWQLSIEWPGAGRSITAFEEAFGRLLAGYPVGYAMETFSERYAELSSDLAGELEVARYGGVLDDETLSCLWTGRNDCRNYAVIGDPAVRLATAPEPAEEPEPDVMRGAVVN